MHPHDVGMADPRHRLGLAPQPQPRPLMVPCGMQQLERDSAVELRIVCRIHDPHRARANPGDDDVAPDGVAS